MRRGSHHETDNLHELFSDPRRGRRSPVGRQVRGRCSPAGRQAHGRRNRVGRRPCGRSRLGSRGCGPIRHGRGGSHRGTHRHPSSGPSPGRNIRRGTSGSRGEALAERSRQSRCPSRPNPDPRSSQVLLLRSAQVFSWVVYIGRSRRVQILCGASSSSTARCRFGFVVRYFGSSLIRLAESVALREFQV